MNNRILVCAAFLAVLSLTACNKQDTVTNPPHGPQLAKASSGPVISSISPSSAEIGDVLTINGSKFGGNFSQRSVMINGQLVSVINTWTVTKIEVLVPSGAAFGTGQVTVTMGSTTTNAVSFTLLPSSPVQIGSQIWMGANLSVTEYRDHTPIPEVTDQGVWNNLTTGAWCYYNNDPSTEPFYGRLYNWYAVNDPRGLAPAGWHVASDDEYKTLSMYLGMSQAEADMSGSYFGTTEGGKMKERGTNLWQGYNYGATNASGFTGLPGGIRKLGGVFDFIGFYAGWWTSTEDVSGGAAWYRGLNTNSSTILRAALGKERGMSVRCIKDNN